MYFLQLSVKRRDGNPPEFIIYSDKNKHGSSTTSNAVWLPIPEMMIRFGNTDTCINSFRLELIK